MEPLTQQESKIMEALSTYIKENGYAPSQRELAKGVGLKSPNTVDYHLKKLESKGLIKCLKNRFRAIELVGRAATNQLKVLAATTRVPLLGTVPAGPLNHATLEDEYIEVDPSLIKGKSLALKVRGDSMRDAGILEGDVVIVRLQQTADNGDIVVARAGEDSTVKYFRQMRGRPFLYPANPRYGPIAADRMEILGKVTGVIRKY